MGLLSWWKERAAEKRKLKFSKEGLTWYELTNEEEKQFIDANIGINEKNKYRAIYFKQGNFIFWICPKDDALSYSTRLTMSDVFSLVNSKEIAEQPNKKEHNSKP